jgi:hypothetical protein
MGEFAVTIDSGFCQQLVIALLTAESHTWLPQTSDGNFPEIFTGGNFPYDVRASPFLLAYFFTALSIFRESFRKFLSLPQTRLFSLNKNYIWHGEFCTAESLFLPPGGQDYNSQQRLDMALKTGCTLCANLAANL